MRKLIEGFVEFRETRLPDYAARFQKLAERQTPDTFFISCSDSRVVPELLASTDPGDLFVMRNVGNLVPPAGVGGHSTGDLSEAGGLEFALLVLEVPNIIICGHSECGAMKAALSDETLPRATNLSQWLHHAASASFRLKQEGPLDDRLPVYDQLAQLNVLVQLEHLATYPIVQERMASGQLQLGGWWFNIRTGEMHCYQRESRSFEPIDRNTAPRLIAKYDR